MRNARIKTSSTDKLRFEVHASTRNGEGIPEKWYMKANHAVEVARWVQTLQRAIEWSKRGKGVDSDTASIRSNKTGIETVRSTESAPPSRKRFSRASGSNVFSSVRRRKSGKTGSSSSVHEMRPPSVQVDNDSSDEEARANTNINEDQPPHQEGFALVGNTAATHMDLAMQFLSTLAVVANDANNEAHISMRASLTQAQEMYSEYAKMVGEREAWFRAKIARERERATIWEESLHKVVQEGEELEEELKKTIRLNKQQRRRSRGFSDIDIEATIRQRPVEHSPPPPLGDTILVPALSPVPEATPTIKVETPAATSPGFVVSAPPTAGLENVEQFAPAPRRMSIMSKRMSMQSEDSDSDEFFDAIEANTLPNMIIPNSLKAETPIPVKDSWISIDDFSGYAHLRERLDLDADNRPPVSLWAVLKGSIGKDLTRISFPVFFSE
jgi:oxysterol-binding protein 1